jgi:hypothetical protein
MTSGTPLGRRQWKARQEVKNRQIRQVFRIGVLSAPSVPSSPIATTSLHNPRNGARLPSLPLCSVTEHRNGRTEHARSIFSERFLNELPT